MKKNEYELVRKLIDIAIEEDIAGGDLATQSIIPTQARSTAIVTAKADGVISGLEIARMVLSVLSDDYTFTPLVTDGDRITKGEDLLRIEAAYNELLSAERLMLNFMQRMSGIATATRKLVNLIEGTGARLLDTRKTAPGHRITDKMAVRHGGGYNHRMGLYDMAMLKDNHIKAAGGVYNAVTAAKQALPFSVKIEVETTNLSEVSEALRGKADIIMLDNMSTEMMKEAVHLISGHALTEASGNITALSIREVAECGVDFISVGALTHTVAALDMSMNFIS